MRAVGFGDPACVLVRLGHAYDLTGKVVPSLERMIGTRDRDHFVDVALPQAKPVVAVSYDRASRDLVAVLGWLYVTDRVGYRIQPAQHCRAHEAATTNVS